MKPNRIIFNLIAENGAGRDDDTLPEPQPWPVDVRLVRMRARSGEIATAVLRVWEPGDSERCQLCPREVCTASDDVCLVGVAERVADQDAALLSLHGRRQQKGV